MLGVVLFLVLIPLIAMQFTNEVKWTLLDFVVASVLLLGTGFMFEFVATNIETRKVKIVIFSTILLLLILIWTELAVGIFGTPFAGN